MFYAGWYVYLDPDTDGSLAKQHSILAMDELVHHVCVDVDIFSCLNPNAGSSKLCLAKFSMSAQFCFIDWG